MAKINYYIWVWSMIGMVESEVGRQIRIIEFEVLLRLLMTLED